MPFRRAAPLFCLAAILYGQQSIPPDEVRLGSTAYVPRTQYSLKAEARLVEVGVVVRDSRGHTVGGLARDDFEVEDGGKKREIAAFTAAMATHPAPGGEKPDGEKKTGDEKRSPVLPPQRFLALLFDDLSMGPGDLIPARKAAKKFLAQGLSAGDLAGIFFMSRGQILPFTADLAKLNDALDKLTIATRNPPLPSCPNLTTYDAYVIANHQDNTLLPVKVAEAMQCGFCQRRDSSCPSNVEALARNVWEQVRFISVNTLSSIGGIVDFMATLPGKRVLLMASSGFLSGTLEFEREEIVNRALRGDVVINSLDAKGLYAQDSGVSGPGMNARSLIARASQGTRPQWESNDTMAILSASTGGLFFHDNNDLELGFRELGLAPEFSYSLAFAPPGAPDGKYHNLKVRLKQSQHYAVQARPGYFAAIVAATPPPSERRIDKELMAAGTLDEVPVRISAVPGKMPTGEPALHVVLHLDVPHLRFANLFDVRSEQLTVIVALFDAAGNFATGKECEVDFNLKENTFNRLAGGMDAGLTLNAPPGRYRLRGVVRDGNEGKITASSLAVEIQE